MLITYTIISGVSRTDQHYDSSRYAKVEDEGGEDIKEQLKDAKLSEMKSGAGRSASVRL